MTEHKWGHNPVRVVWKQRLRINCQCGKQSPVYRGDEREEQADAWYRDHVGLREKVNREGRS